jgi:DNA helicase II / ATP-dependent DNA helicase PcrA
MHRDAIFADLNPEQRRAVETVRGPVCILAGAGSGKTTTITRRIANQIATGAFYPDEILAVTFTDKAAGEMRHRLAVLGVDGVQARTFHSAALGQLHRYGRTPTGGVLPSKVILLSQVARSLPRVYRFRPLGDLATEIEWAKNRRLTFETYEHSLGDHRPPIPSDLMARVIRDYERRKQALGRIDFEDVLELAVRMFDEDEQARGLFRDRFRAFTVDEFQDVNLLQHTLLERWLGATAELCVVGDDYQSIYSFVGATPRYLLDLAKRFPQAAVIRLESNYRSTPQILGLANRLTPQLGGAEKILRPARADGPEPVILARDGPEETRFIVEQSRALHTEQGIPYDEMAVLYRMNARSESYEQAFAGACIPVQVREGAFLTRQAARRVRAQLAALTSTTVAASVREAAERDGFLEAPPERLGDQEAVRQADLARLIQLAEDYDDASRTVADFLTDLENRFGPSPAGRGVHLLTYHRAKGLEFDVVFLPRLEEKELPIRLARSPEELAEERRLFYVGMTRAKRYLYLLRSDGAKPSRFLRELGVVAPARAPRVVEESHGGSPAYAALAAWRRRRAERDGVAAFVVFHNATLEEIVRRRPRTHDELAVVPGVGAMKLERYGSEVLEALAAA